MKKTISKVKKTKIAKPLDVVTSNYTATIKVLGKTFQATGQTAREAIGNLKPGNCKGRAILSIEKDGSKRDRILMPPTTFRLFNSSGFTKEVTLKNVSLLFS